MASTTVPPVSAANVKISLSTDGGNTFPTVLAASTPNDGSRADRGAEPDHERPARIKVEAVGNVFFDISNANFAITASSTAALTCPTASVAPGAAFSTTVSGGSSTLDWLASYPAGAPNSPVPAFRYVPLPRPATVSVTAPATVGVYDLRLFANDGFTLIGTCSYQVATLPSLSINDVTVTEGNSGPVVATFNVTLSPAATGTVTVHVATADGTAMAGSDYLANGGTVTFAPGETVQTVTVTVTGDTTPEATETFSVNLTSPSEATIQDAQGQGTITNDDGAPPTLTCPSSPVMPGASFTTTVTAGSSALDWMASYPLGAPNSPVPPYQYVPLPRPITRTVTAPTAVGMYELRLFANDTFALIGSCPYQVSTGPALSINDVTVMEGNSGTVSATFNVTLSPVASGTVTVNFGTANGTASAGADYAANAGMLSFAPGESLKTVVVDVSGDTTPETTETFFVNLSTPSGATILDGQGLGTITNDDGAPPAVTCPSSPVLPGATFSTTVTGGSSAMDWMASYAAGAPNSPVPPYQYVPLPRPITRTLTAPGTVGMYDLRLFANDTFTLIGSCTYQVATGPALSINDVTVTEGNSGTTIATFNVTLSPVSAGTVTVNFGTANGTAAAGEDYAASSGTLTFAAGESLKTVSVDVAGDTTAEANETFVVTLNGASGAMILDGQGQTTITNDDGPVPAVTCPPSPVMGGASFTTTVTAGSSARDWIASYAQGAPFSPAPPYQYVPLPRPTVLTMVAPVTSGWYELRLFANDSYSIIGACSYRVEGPPALSIDNATWLEGDSGPFPVTFAVWLSPVSTGTVTVNYATANGTAIAGADYGAVSGTLTFAPGESLKVVTVPVIGDATPEVDETFFVNLSSPSGATIQDGQGQGTIQNNDGPLPPLECPSVPVAPGTSFTVIVSSGTSAKDWLAPYEPGAPNSPVPQNWQYVPLPRPVTRTLGAPTAVGTHEVRLFADDGFGLLGSCTYLVAITPALAINDVALSEFDSGTRNAESSVSLTPASTQAVSVNFATADGTATAGSDYVANSGTLVFAPGETQKTVVVTVNSDTTVEFSETIIVSLSAPSGAVLLDGQGVATISNDDFGSLSVNDVTVTEGNSGSTSANFTVSLNPPAVFPVSVGYSTFNGTAVVRATPHVFTASAVTINHDGPASPYPSSITVPPLAGAVEKVTVTLSSFRHTFPRDVDVLLVGPTGRAAVLMSDAGGNISVSGISLTFDDAVPVALPFGGRLESGTFRPTNFEDLEGSDDYPSPAPAGLQLTSLATFIGENPAGSWRLYVRDDFPGDQGGVDGGWSLSIWTRGDYATTSGTLTFLAGESTKAVTVPVLGDIGAEPDETFSLNLTSPTGATIVDSQGQATILNDDCADADGDHLCDTVETNTHVFVSAANTGTDPNNPDTDGDGIKDGDEVAGHAGRAGPSGHGNEPAQEEHPPRVRLVRRQRGFRCLRGPQPSADGGHGEPRGRGLCRRPQRQSGRQHRNRAHSRLRPGRRLLRREPRAG